MPRTTRAIVQTGPRRLELRELPLPEIDDESALLLIEACGICGSDAEQYTGTIRSSIPSCRGHEPLGVLPLSWLVGAVMSAAPGTGAMDTDHPAEEEW